MLGSLLGLFLFSSLSLSLSDPEDCWSSFWGFAWWRAWGSGVDVCWRVWVVAASPVLGCWLVYGFWMRSSRLLWGVESVSFLMVVGGPASGTWDGRSRVGVALESGAPRSLVPLGGVEEGIVGGAGSGL